MLLLFFCYSTYVTHFKNLITIKSLKYQKLLKNLEFIINYFKILKFVQIMFIFIPLINLSLEFILYF